MVLKAGRMNCPIEIRRMSTSQDSVGQQVRSWTVLGRAMASILPVRGREYFLASGDKADVTHEIHTRYRDDFFVTPRDRVTYGARIFDIKSALNNDERNRELVMMCIEVLNTDDVDIDG